MMLYKVPWAIKYLNDNGYNINKKFTNGGTLLHIVSAFDSSKIRYSQDQNLVKELLDLGADPNA